MTRGERQINWNLRDVLCDACLAKTERNEDADGISDTPISEYCSKCKIRIWRWTCDVFGSEPTEEEIRSLRDE
jgi:hypothetical protein